MEIKFLVRIRGALTPPPRMDDPVMKIPLERRLSAGDAGGFDGIAGNDAHHAAPTTEKPIHKAIPILAQV